MSEQEKWREYARQKRDFLRKNPGATGRQIEEECKRIARKLGL